MDQLDLARQEINALDAQLAALFEKRMRAAAKVAAYKKAHGLPVLDAAREQAVIARNSALIEDPALRPYYISSLKHTMRLSRQYQHTLLEEQCGTVLKVCTERADYDVIIAPGCLDRAGDLLALDRRVLIVTDSGVPASYAERLVAQCKEPVVYTVAQGEGSKSPERFEQLLQTMLKHGFTRRDCVAAVGGGVVGDLAGFAAASYMRGIDFYNLPTTVLSMVDSSIGGKTAVNLGGVKNIVGAFYQPKRVLIDTDTLQTLPPRQIANGLAEAVKMAMTSDAELFSLLAAGETPMQTVIARALAIKKAVVEQDETEQGLRKILNFGHTIGHGIEAQGGLYHGECVALGMLPMCSETARAQLLPVLQKLNLPTAINLNEQAVFDALTHDKKSAEGGVDVVYVETIGSCEIRRVSFAEIKHLLSYCRSVK